MLMVVGIQNRGLHLVLFDICLLFTEFRVGTLVHRLESPVQNLRQSPRGHVQRRAAIVLEWFPPHIYAMLRGRSLQKDIRTSSAYLHQHNPTNESAACSCRLVASSEQLEFASDIPVNGLCQGDKRPV